MLSLNRLNVFFLSIVDSLPQSSEDGDPLTHEAAKYVIREKIFGSNLEMVKLGMNLLLEKMGM